MPGRPLKKRRGQPADWGTSDVREQQGALYNAAADFTSALKVDSTNKRARDGQARVKARMEESK